MLLSAVTKFSEAIIEYVANLDKAPDNTVTKQHFEGEIFSVYELLFNNWLQSKEVKVSVRVNVHNLAQLQINWRSLVKIMILIIMIMINFIVSNREISINVRRSASAQLAEPGIEPRTFQLLGRCSIH
jgi:hypothetical protein